MNAPAISRRPLPCLVDTTGGIRDYDRLSDALAAWHRRSSPANLAALDEAAKRCGMSDSFAVTGDPVSWSERRLTTLAEAVGG